MAMVPRSHADVGVEGGVEHIQLFALKRLQACWRGHLARQHTEKLRYQSKSKLQRTFSWSNKSKRSKAGGKARDPTKVKTAKDILAADGIDELKPKPVRRSMSFDRFSRGVSNAFGKVREDSTKAPAAAPTMTKQLLFILLHRGPNGLGLELDATNTVVNMVPGGAAETQGYFREGDTIASVDGIPLRGRLLQDVMDRAKNSCVAVTVEPVLAGPASVAVALASMAVPCPCPCPHVASCVQVLLRCLAIESSRSRPTNIQSRQTRATCVLVRSEAAMTSLRMWIGKQLLSYLRVQMKISNGVHRPVSDLRASTGPGFISASEMSVAAQRRRCARGAPGARRYAPLPAAGGRQAGSMCEHAMPRLEPSSSTTWLAGTARRLGAGRQRGHSDAITFAHR